MKKLQLLSLIVCAVAVLLCGCRDTADAVDAGDTIAKAQEIAVLPAGADEPVRTITEQDELDDFVHALALETWRPEAVPADAAAVGQFELSQESTKKFGESGEDETLHPVCCITLYDGPYIGLEIAGMEMAFRISDDAAGFLNGFFE
ncbi:MAG TPA: hypothetical protein H9739_06445 [Candidatus Agathobaculum pullistercoris]|nr:hypothetical protein [uncultured Agathobaculum sp.]HIX11205.1 hypothetical protein [Candidatus Agathobaculum pullistercoris]